MFIFGYFNIVIKIVANIKSVSKKQLLSIDPIIKNFIQEKVKRLLELSKYETRTRMHKIRD